MYAVINTFSAIPGDSMGTIISQHHTAKVARAAMEKAGREVRRNNGGNSYLPMQVVRLKCAHKTGEHVSPRVAEIVWE